MHDAAAAPAPNRKVPLQSLTRLRASLPTPAEASLAIASALLLVLSFPDFDLWWLAWVGLVPLLVAVTRTRDARSAFLLGELWGMIFFYGTCWWLTYPMIHYAHVAAWLAYPLLLLPILLVALFPALFCLLLARAVSRFGSVVLLGAPLLWVSLDLARYATTGQLWNAIGYSQAFHPILMQSARWGGVYAVSSLILLSNAAIANLLVRRKLAGSIVSLVIIVLLVLASAGIFRETHEVRGLRDRTYVKVIAVQPNVPMEGPDDPASMNQLLNRHLELSKQALANRSSGPGGSCLVI